VHRHKVEHAIFEIRDMLREMQGDKVLSKPLKTAAEHTDAADSNK